MLKIAQAFAVAAGAAGLLVSAAIAGESTTTVHSASDGVGSSTTVHHASSDALGTRSKTVHASSGPGGAHVSRTKNSVEANPDGSITASHKHASTTMDAAGVSHHASKQSTTVGPGGSVTTEKHEARTTTP